MSWLKSQGAAPPRTPARHEPPYRVLRHRDFRFLWLSQLVSLTGSQMQTVALHWHVYLLTRSPLALGALGLTRVLPIVVFSLWGGVAADRFATPVVRDYVQPAAPPQA